jgi:uroporphyrinogen-III synthase
MARYKVLSTKKLHASLLLLAEATEIEILEKEFISIQPLAPNLALGKVIPFLDGKPYSVVFTSANAASVLDDIFQGLDMYPTPKWKVFCLAGRTKDALPVTIPDEAIMGTGVNAADLAQQIIAKEEKEVVFFCGNQRRDDLPQMLLKAGIGVQEVIVYETLELPSLADEDLDGVLFFSPSAVHSFFSMNQLPAKTVCFAIGLTTASAIADYTDNKIITSEGTSQEMMMATMLFYFQNINCYE